MNLIFDNDLVLNCDHFVQLLHSFNEKAAHSLAEALQRFILSNGHIKCISRQVVINLLPRTVFWPQGPVWWGLDVKNGEEANQQQPRGSWKQAHCLKKQHRETLTLIFSTSVVSSWTSCSRRWYFCWGVSFTPSPSPSWRKRPESLINSNIKITRSSNLLARFHFTPVPTATVA